MWRAKRYGLAVLPRQSGKDVAASMEQSEARLRTAKTKGCGSRQECLTMVFKLCQSAEKHWRKLNGCALLKEVGAGVEFVDGIRKAA